jgi:hypothetical protein
LPAARGQSARTADLASRSGTVGKRGYEAMERGFHDHVPHRRRLDRGDVALDHEQKPDRRDSKKVGEVIKALA